MNGHFAESIRRIGFRKWYERQLLSSHAHMVLASLSVIALAGSMEAIRGSAGDALLANSLFVVVCAGIGLWALRRYLFLLMRAEETANQANCPGCGEYGRFRVVAHHPRHEQLDVRCSRCSHDWTISRMS